MVSITPLCAALYVACSLFATSEGVSDQQSTNTAMEVMSVKDNEDIYETRKTHDELEEILDEYFAEQERLAEEARIRAEEEARIKAEEEARLRAEEEARIAEENRLRQQLESYAYENYRQTYYSVQEGEVKLGSGLHANSSDVSVINNIMHYNDSEYGYLPIYAINLDTVLSSGFNEQGTPNIYGSVIQIKNDAGDTWLGFVGDACGACRYANKIDLWVYNNNSVHDISGLSWKYIRKGY